ncbi:hypothetical protein IE81DRAFT_365576 [Ceraceosorus guamensis]|uniref:Gamma tubulin complex component C-terminal domain-containing protein n=1 Tax=Ceraceosorus guamensis TaxID=1522189 RepID=A0A316W1F8_9BASI|nr:hypothetical protein IE81DRAFT_365576 [Ceraceosorus guamensis]PWN43737.1 hypothetical protein IE81DRAFT_365576 [Ceraceosorus guamensis]
MSHDAHSLDIPALDPSQPRSISIQARASANTFAGSSHVLDRTPSGLSGLPQLLAISSLAQPKGAFNPEELSDVFHLPLPGDGSTQRRLTDYAPTPPLTPPEEGRSPPRIWSWDSDERLVEPFLSDRMVNERDASTAEALALVLAKYDHAGPSSSSDASFAPAHSQESVRESLELALASHASTHFAWDADKARFVWRLTHDRRVRASAANGKGKSRSVDGITEWIGEERIHGYTASTSKAIAAPFLEIGALRRRIELRLEELSVSTDVPIPEVFALAAAIRQVVEWLGNELEGRIKENDISMESSRLDVPRRILASLSMALACDVVRKPPFPSFGVWCNVQDIQSQPSQLAANLLGRLYAEAEAQLTAGDALSAAALAFVLEQVSKTWRADVAAWIGWPGSSAREEMYLGSDGVFEPWTGAEIRWSRDTRGELDVGYELRLRRVPYFLPAACARDLLEGGRALRLLRKAAPSGHPLLSYMQTASKHTLPAPSWLWSKADYDRHQDRLLSEIAHLKRSIAHWRHGRIRHASPSRPSSPATIPTNDVAGLAEHAALQEAPKAGRDVAWSATHASLERALKLFDQTPGSSLPSLKSDDVHLPPALAGDEDVSTGNPVAETSSLLTHLGHAAQASDGQRNDFALSVSIVIYDSYISPMLEWSRLLNSALLSCYFRDFGLTTYLETCRQFLLLGDASFLSRVSMVLFEQGDESGTLEEGWSPGLGRILNVDEAWPPGRPEIRSKLNASVVESLADLRRPHEERGESSAEARALSDLDARLSFAFVQPDDLLKGKRNKRSWQDKHSIDGLDWLTLSFEPPPLIAPLLHVNISTRYQRLFNQLLKFVRTQAVLRALFEETVKGKRPESAYRNRKDANRARNPKTTPTRLPFDYDQPSREICLRFRREVHHITTVLFAFTTSAIDESWTRFKARLRELHDEAEARDGLSSGFKDIAMLENDDDEASGAPPGSSRSQPALEIKDVFSLALYHETTLERLLQTCFLRARQADLRVYIDSILNSALGLLTLCREDLRSTQSDATAPARMERLRGSYAKFTSRVRGFVRTLHAIRERDSAGASRVAGAASATLKANAKQTMSRKAREERRLMKMTEEDLKILEGQNAHIEANVDSVNELIARLDFAGYF